MIKLLLIGSGPWGQKYVSTLHDFNNVSLTIANRDNWKSLIDENQDGVIICTPPQSHVEIANYALYRHTPVMVEKPLSLSLKEAKMLSEYDIPILVNHVHLFSNRYQEIKRNILYYKIKKIWTTGFGPAPVRDYSDLWDFGPHEIAMILDLIQDFPHTIGCQKLRDRYYTIRLEFDNAITESYIGYSTYKDKYLKATYYDNEQVSFEYDDKAHNIEDRPLANAIRVFIDAIKGKTDYRLGLNLTLKVLQVLEQCQYSLDNFGLPI
jgi:predicted dehydrogenase